MSENTLSAAAMNELLNQDERLYGNEVTFGNLCYITSIIYDELDPISEFAGAHISADC